MKHILHIVLFLVAVQLASCSASAPSEASFKGVAYAQSYESAVAAFDGFCAPTRYDIHREVSADYTCELCGQDWHLFVTKDPVTGKVNVITVESPYLDDSDAKSIYQELKKTLKSKYKYAGEKKTEKTSVITEAEFEALDASIILQLKHKKDSKDEVLLRYKPLETSSATSVSKSDI